MCLQDVIPFRLEITDMEELSHFSELSATPNPLKPYSLWQHRHEK